MKRTWEITATALLTLPGLLLAGLIVQINSQNSLLAGVTALVATVLAVTLHLSAKIVAKRLRSERLPWMMWGFAIVAQAAVLFAIVLINVHFNRVDAGFADPSLGVTAPITAIVCLAAALAFIATGVVATVRFSRAPALA